MPHVSPLHALLAEADRDPLLEAFLLTAIDDYAEALADLDEAALREKVLAGSPRQSPVGIDAAGWKARALRVRAMLRQAGEAP